MFVLLKKAMKSFLGDSATAGTSITANVVMIRYRIAVIIKLKDLLQQTLLYWLRLIWSISSWFSTHTRNLLISRFRLVNWMYLAWLLLDWLTDLIDWLSDYRDSFISCVNSFLLSYAHSLLTLRISIAFFKFRSFVNGWYATIDWSTVVASAWTSDKRCWTLLRVPVQL